MGASKQPAGDFGIAEQIRAIRGNAVLVIGMFAKETDFEFGYNDQSVQWLDNYIEHIRTRKWTDEEFNQIVSNLGSYLGEAIIAACGGSWALDHRGWAVRWDDLNRTYPFTRVARQLKSGAEDSIYNFYTTTLTLRNE